MRSKSSYQHISCNLPSMHSQYLLGHRVYEYTYVHVHAEKRGGGGAGRGLRWARKWKDLIRNLILADKLKPIGATVLLVEESFAVGELSCLASFAFRRIWAVEVGDMLVADVAEPNCTQVIVVGFI